MKFLFLPFLDVVPAPDFNRRGDLLKSDLFPLIQAGAALLTSPQVMPTGLVQGPDSGD